MVGGARVASADNTAAGYQSIRPGRNDGVRKGPTRQAQVGELTERGGIS
jgi:hypothetical protein